MNTAPLKVGVVGLGEAGNLGDDLILIATVDAVYDAYPEAEIEFLSFGQELDWRSIAIGRGYPAVPKRVRHRFEVPLFRQNAWTYRDRDVIIFGGGGLLQTSHNKDRPYGWLSYLPRAGVGSPRVLATGLGLGPLSNAWVHRLQRMGTPFDLAWLRDPDSVALSKKSLGWAANECSDFIDSTFLGSWGLKSIEGDRTRTLGVALRLWPGFTPEAAAEHIRMVYRRHKCKKVILFVLESNRGGGIDVDFSTRVSHRANLPVQVCVYQPQELMEFLQEMAEVDIAISMKLHSSAIWATLGVPMYPVVYAPKIAALFGLEYRGFQIVDAVVPVPEVKVGVPRASETVGAGLRTLANSLGGDGGRLGFFQRNCYPTKSLIKAVARKAGALLSTTSLSRGHGEPA